MVSANINIFIKALLGWKHVEKERKRDCMTGAFFYQDCNI